MTTNIASNDIIRCRVWCDDGNNAAVNTYHFRVTALTGDVTDLEVATFLDPIFGDLTDGYPPMVANTCFYMGLQIYLITRTPLPFPADATAARHVGTAGANCQGRQVAGMLSWQTIYAGPGGRGRTYLPFVSTSSATGDGLPSTTYLSNMESLALRLLAPLNIVGAGGTATIQLVLLKDSGGTIPINSFITRPKFATQKRRGSYGRLNRSPI